MEGNEGDIFIVFFRIKFLKVPFGHEGQKVEFRDVRIKTLGLSIFSEIE